MSETTEIDPAFTNTIVGGCLGVCGRIWEMVGEVFFRCFFEGATPPFKDLSKFFFSEMLYGGGGIFSPRLLVFNSRKTQSAMDKCQHKTK